MPRIKLTYFKTFPQNILLINEFEPRETGSKQDSTNLRVKEIY